MKSLKHHIRSFFGFSRAQTNGFISLLMIISVALFSKPVYHTWVSNRENDFSEESKKLDSLFTAWKAQQAKEVEDSITTEPNALALFMFNPNNASASELKALGFTDKLTKRLINYRAKGGTFRIKTDVKKLYGMDSSFYNELSPFIQLPDKITYEKAAPFAITKKTKIVFNLNEADTTLLQAVYGVGPVLSKRIIKYRERLGGFIKSEQLQEVYGLDSTVIKSIVKASFLSETFSPRKININTAEESTLSAHPYFSKKTAKAIVAYRFQHGNYQLVEDLGKIEIIDKRSLEKIYPYVTAE